MISVSAITPSKSKISRSIRCRCLSITSSYILAKIGRWPGAPEIHRLATDPNHHLVEVPTGTGARSTAPQSLGEGGPELQHPAPDRLVGEIDATLGQEILHVSVTQGEAHVQPDSVLDDNGRELVAGVRDRQHLSILCAAATVRPFS